MKKQRTSRLSLFAAVSLLAAGSLFAGSTLTACASGTEAQNPDNTGSDTAQTVSAAETEDTTPVYEADNLPESLDFGGTETHIFGWEGSSTVEFFVEEADGDIVNDAIYLRNQTVEDRLNTVLTFTCIPGANPDRASWVKAVKQSTMAGDGTNDIVAGYSMCGASLAFDGMLVDLSGLDYLDFSKPWWPASLIREATCGDRLYFCSGDISTNMIYYLYATYFNKTLARNYDTENFYTLVRNGQWTLDKMNEICADLYSDLNGDGKKDEADQFGYVTHTTWSDVHFFASGLRTTEIGSDGLPVLSAEFGGEKTQELLNRLIDMFDGSSMYLGNDYDVVRTQFLESRALLLTIEVMFASNYLRDSDIEYGILPIPKYDEAQEDYYTVASFPYTLYGIPVDAKDPAMSAAVLECLASESYRTVSPALFETALKVKYAGDSDTSDMYDIIRSSVVFDIGRIFNDSMNSLTYSLFRSALSSGSRNWISTYEKNAKTLGKKFDQVILALTENAQ